MRRGLFVTGTDTGVGKTVVSAALLHRYGARTTLRYWKPIQTGTEQDDDTHEVRRLAAGAPVECLDEGVRLPRPVSPHLAASLAGQTIDLQEVVDPFELYPLTDRWIVEGAGGVLVPVNPDDLMIDLMSRLGLAVLVVARSSLGTINHTLLTVESVRARALDVAGIVMVGKPDRHNRSAIEEYGRVSVVGEMPCFDHLTPSGLAAWAEGELDPTAQLWEYLQ